MRRQVTRRGIPLAAIAALVGFAVTVPSWGASTTGFRITREYAACMRMARVDPEEGFESALAWTDAGGGGAARHCAAVALFSMGQYGEAAVRFEALANGFAERPAIRASLLAQAGQAWHQAGEIDRAYAVHTLALGLTPKDPDIRVDRAMVLAERGQYWQAIDDLNLSLEVDRNMVEALVLRASAYRFVDALELAFQDVSQALKLSPHYPEALLERGNILRLRGDADGARRDWLMLLRLYEGTPAADAAQRNIEKLDVRSD